MSMELSARKRLLLAFVLVNAAILGTAALVLDNRPPQPPDIEGVFLPQARALPPFELLDHNSEVFDNSDLEGRWHLVSYGFTTCPDICPTFLADLARFKEQLPRRHDDLGMAFYSVDHRRDTPDQLTRYLSFFSPEFIGLTHRDGNDNRHLPFETGLGMVSRLVPAEDGSDDYQVNHGVTLFLLNPAGKLQAIFRPTTTRGGQPGFEPDVLLRDYLAIRDYLG